MAFETRKAYGTNELDGGPFLAKVISHMDPSYMGMLQVQLLREAGGDTGVEGQTFPVRYMSPFYGVTSAEHVSPDPDNYNNTQKSYGMWAIPPDVGTIVVVIFIQGDVKKGYWIGCVQSEGDNMNFMVPGYAATKFVNDTKVNADAERVPVAEYNRQAAVAPVDATKAPKPAHPFETVLFNQGLLLDDIRGITTSSARREVPSMVFGISTPGPVDKQGGAKQGPVGKSNSRVANAFVSRLGGSSFVMDDGDDKFLRKTPASEGPPEYAAVEQGETDGDVTIPHNELIRFRTRTGHQILMHNSEDLMYIGNARGTSWIELSSDGKIDIYAEDSISVHTKQDLNFYADRDINLEAGRNLNIKAKSEMHTHVVEGNHILVVETGSQKIKVQNGIDIVSNNDVKVKVDGTTHLHSTADNRFQADGNTHIKTSGQHIEQAGVIHMNGPTASAATDAEEPQLLKTHILPSLDTQNAELAELETIVRRVPMPEPYPHHENLDPVKFKPEQTDRDVDGRYDGNSTSLKEPPQKYKQYSTATDTFEKVGEANQG